MMVPWPPPKIDRIDTTPVHTSTSPRPRNATAPSPRPRGSKRRPSSSRWVATSVTTSSRTSAASGRGCSGAPAPRRKAIARYLARSRPTTRPTQFTFRLLSVGRRRRRRPRRCRPPSLPHLEGVAARLPSAHMARSDACSRRRIAWRVMERQAGLGRSLGDVLDAMAPVEADPARRAGAVRTPRPRAPGRPARSDIGDVRERVQRLVGLVADRRRWTAPANGTHHAPSRDAGAARAGRGQEARSKKSKKSKKSRKSNEDTKAKTEVPGTGRAPETSGRVRWFSSWYDEGVEHQEVPDVVLRAHAHDAAARRAGTRRPGRRDGGARHPLRQRPPAPAAVPRGARDRDLALGCFWGAERAFWQTDGVFTTAVAPAASPIRPPRTCGGP